MIEFLNDLQSYIAKAFEEDEDIKTAVPVFLQYMQAHKPGNEIQIMGLDYGTDAAYESYESENVAYVPVQIVPITSKQIIAGTQYSAQISALKYAGKIRDLLEKTRATKWNKNIMRISRVGMEFSVPYESGSAFYVAPMRFDVYVKVPYESVSGSVAQAGKYSE